MEAFVLVYVFSLMKTVPVFFGILPSVLSSAFTSDGHLSPLLVCPGEWLGCLAVIIGCFGYSLLLYYNTEKEGRRW